MRGGSWQHNGECSRAAWKSTVCVWELRAGVTRRSVPGQCRRKRAGETRRVEGGMAGNASGGETRNLAGRRPGVWSGGATQGSVPERHDVEAGKPETTSPAETSKRVGGVIRGLQDVLSGSNDDPGSPGGFIRVKRQGLTPLAFFFVCSLGAICTFSPLPGSPPRRVNSLRELHR